MSTNVGNDLLVLLSDAARQMRTYADQVAQAHGLTRAQWIILARLERKADLSQNELAAIAEVTPMTVARLVDRLEALGLVKRCIDPTDRRIWRLRADAGCRPGPARVERGAGETAQDHHQGHRSVRAGRDGHWSAPDEGKCEQPAAC